MNVEVSSRVQTIAMTLAAVQPKLTFEEYIDICDQRDERYELVHGNLIKMTPPTVLHYRIAKLLEQMFDQLIAAEIGAEAWETFREAGQRTEDDSSRLPDLAIVARDEADKLLRQTAVFQSPSLIVVEIVSPSSATEDYDAKLKEYQVLGIKEYWIVDPEGLGAAKYIGFPKAPTITVYRLEAGQYKGQRFRGRDRIVSPKFGVLELTVEQIVRGKK
ncbi:MAG: Uma2 family endonuclease [Leptolyngbyaceae cyanobacterium SM1_3_5]|nr:Uma2 family endonuclease [Leptolyngbyaceae cyanobacterium SM1_3_5]